MDKKKILTMQDLSCVGQCSITVALPILSAYGYETCVLPTAILSNHTMFDTWSYLDLTNEIDDIFANWHDNKFKFDYFLLGYLGKKELIDKAIECFDKFSNKDSKIFIDPVFADDGKIYPGFNKEYIEKTRELLKHANFILPNVTEVCYLTNIEYQPIHSQEFVRKLASELKKYTDATIIITGVINDNSIGEYILKGKEEIILKHELLPIKRHGTGDIFSSVFLANYLLTNDVKKACNKAALFVRKCLKTTDTKHFYGVEFEKVLTDDK